MHVFCHANSLARNCPPSISNGSLSTCRFLLRGHPRRLDLHRRHPRALGSRPAPRGTGRLSADAAARSTSQAGSFIRVGGVHSRACHGLPWNVSGTGMPLVLIRGTVWPCFLPTLTRTLCLPLRGVPTIYEHMRPADAQFFDSGPFSSRYFMSSPAQWLI